MLIGQNMFGMGFMEIMLIVIIAVIALGPEKLPTAMVDMAKMLKKVKGGIDDAKQSIDNELNISEMKGEADKLKAQLSYSTDRINTGLDDILADEPVARMDSTRSHSEPIRKKTKVSFKDREKKPNETLINEEV
jgi:sec-independent protein translocase protein TatB